MTNPKHTDTSRIDDLRFQVSEKMPINHSDLSGLFDHIEALEAEIERLRGALHEANHLMDYWFTKHETLRDALVDILGRAALGEKQ